MDKNSFVVKNMENSLIWSTRAASVKDLVMLLSFTMARQETDLQKKLHLECVKSLERRWVEIKGETC